MLTIKLYFLKIKIKNKQTFLIISSIFHFTCTKRERERERKISPSPGQNIAIIPLFLAFRPSSHSLKIQMYDPFY